MPAWICNRPPEHTKLIQTSEHTIHRWWLSFKVLFLKLEASVTCARMIYTQSPTDLELQEGPRLDLQYSRQIVSNPPHGSVLIDLNELIYANKYQACVIGPKNQSELTTEAKTAPLPPPPSKSGRYAKPSESMLPYVDDDTQIPPLYHLWSRIDRQARL